MYPNQFNKSERPAQESTMTGGITGDFQIKDIDKFWLDRLEGTKSNYLMFFNSMNALTAQDELCNILSDMQQVLRKYFAPPATTKDFIAEYKVLAGNGKYYNFYDVKTSLGRGPINNAGTIRAYAEFEFSIYESFIKQLGQGLPTSKPNIRKK